MIEDRETGRRGFKANPAEGGGVTVTWLTMLNTVETWEMGPATAETYARKTRPCDLFTKDELDEIRLAFEIASEGSTPPAA